MIKYLFFILAAVSIGLAWLFPTDATIWRAFIAEFLAFLAVLFLSAAHFNQKLKLPSLSLPILIVAAIPVGQYFLGMIAFSTAAFLSVSYLLAFWLVLAVSYSFSQEDILRKKLMQGFCYTLLASASLSSIAAIIQWLNIYTTLPIMMPLTGIRPYANFGQPNHLSTLLLMSILAGAYLFENRKIHSITLIIFTLLNVFVVALTQSRTSWVVVPVIIALWLYKVRGHHYRLDAKHVAALAGSYLICIFALPFINKLIKTDLGMTNIVQTADVIQRATTEHERLDLWSTAITLIGQKPWAGYGWYQTGAAHLQAIDKFPMWFTSAHNIVLDLLIWNGVTIGGAIVAYALWWFWQLLKSANSLESTVSILMIVVVLIHALFEYPLFYSYFLLPVGLLLGIANSDLKQKQITLPKLATPMAAIVMAIMLASVWIEYVNSFTLMANAKSIESYRLSEEKPIYDEQTYLPYNDKHYIILSMLDARAQWIAVNPFTHVSESDIEKYGHVVSFSPSKYDLYKYAQLLAYNGRPTEAEHYLHILEVIHGSKYSLDYAESRNLFEEGKDF